jgi:putative endonuclease
VVLRSSFAKRTSEAGLSASFTVLALQQQLPPSGGSCCYLVFVKFRLYNSSMFYVYILKSCADGSLYKGCTQNLQKRVSEHNSGSAQYSSSKRPYHLIWYCAFHDKTTALRFEKYLKHGSGHAFTKKHLL